MSISEEKCLGLTGIIPIAKADEDHQVLERFSGHDIAVCIMNKDTNIFKGTHSHDSYEFVLCYTDMPSTIIDNSVYNRGKNTIFSVNPMQEHGMAIDYKGLRLCGIHINKSLIHEVANDMYNMINIVFSNDSFSIDHDLNMLIRMYLEELRYKQVGHDFIIENLGVLIVGNLMRKIEHSLSSNFQNIDTMENDNISKVIDYMNENYINGISCTELSKIMNTGKFNFIRTFKSKMGKTPYEYLLDLKMEKAKKMIKTNQYTITEISLMCGFSSHSHFASTFKKRIGMSPTEFKIKL